jgi:hypothetical protein
MAGMPFEELLLPLVSTSGALLLSVRGLLAHHLTRRRRAHARLRQPAG